ncbi:GntR family transcriptional regulator [Streptosporangium sp. NPDC000396]|uniref:GntR family transcriptional regulator n=1 Tax=Streptosporangium sp. NPDC000396 TaxID=3366185 RepID=UPI0036A0AB81
MNPAASVPKWLMDPPDLGAGSSLPAHTRIEQWLRQVIDRGDLVPGDRLPGEENLAGSLGVSRMTLRQALASLESLGIVVRKPGRVGGTFVSEPKIECDLTGLAGFTEQMRQANVRPGARLISATTLPATRQVADALSVERGSPIHEIVRVRTANRQPVALERACFPAEPFPDLLSYGLTGSIYRLLARHYGKRPHMATENLEPVIPNPDEAAWLGVDITTPLLLIERTAFTSAGLAVEYARDLWRSDRVRISLRTGLTSSPRLKPGDSRR